MFKSCNHNQVKAFTYLHFCLESNIEKLAKKGLKTYQKGVDNDRLKQAKLFVLFLTVSCMYSVVSASN